jgi:hypothetical protein
VSPLSALVRLRGPNETHPVVQVHPGLRINGVPYERGRSAFAAFEELIKLSTMDVFGKPSDHLLEQIRQKVRVLGMRR